MAVSTVGSMQKRLDKSIGEWYNKKGGTAVSVALDTLVHATASKGSLYL